MASSSADPTSNEHEPSQWMGNLPNEKQLCPLRELVIPGSHDSGTFALDKHMEVGPDKSPLLQRLSHCLLIGKLEKSVIYNWGKAQSMSIYDQLFHGIRYLDLRVAYREKDKTIRILHGLYAWTVEQTSNDVNRFVSEFPNEIVILDFNHFYNMSPSAHESLADSLRDSFDGIIRAPGKDGTNVTLQEMWAKGEKVIILYHDKGVIDAYPCFWPGDLICSPWPNTADINHLMEFLENEYKKPSCPKDVFKVTQAILTPQTSTLKHNLIGNLEDFGAKKVNSRVTEWLKELPDSKYCDKFNIIIVDFVEIGDFIPTVISFNYNKS